MRDYCFLAVVRLLIAAISSIFPCVNANELPKISMREQVELSDVIFIGEIVGAGPENSKQGVNASVVVKVDATVKGVIEPGSAVFVTRGHLVELDPDCCKASARYLIFARRRPDGLLYAVNGPLSTFKVENEQVLKWPDGIAEESCSLRSVVGYIESLGRR